MISNIIPQTCDNKNITEIFAICKQENLAKKFDYEPRISCKAGKKGLAV